MSSEQSKTGPADLERSGDLTQGNVSPEIEMSVDEPTGLIVSLDRFKDLNIKEEDVSELEASSEQATNGHDANEKAARGSRMNIEDVPQAQTSSEQPKKGYYAILRLGDLRITGKDVPFSKLYRVQYEGCITENVYPHGLRAQRPDMDWDFLELRRAFRYLIARSDIATPRGMDRVYGAPISTSVATDASGRPRLLSPFVPLFSIKERVRDWAVKMSIKTCKACTIFEIDPRALPDSNVLVAIDERLVDKFHIMIDERQAARIFGEGLSYEEAETYVCFGGIPEEAILKEYKWGISVGATHGIS